MQRISAAEGAAPLPARVPLELAELVMSMLRTDPAERPTCAEVAAHPALGGEEASGP